MFVDVHRLDDTTDTITAAQPVYRSSVYVLTPRIYAATRDNVLGYDLTRRITRVPVDADIDRAGIWIAPFVG